MKAIISTKYGSPDVLELRKVDRPAPKDDEVLIRVYAASVSTADSMMRTGKPYIGRLFTGISKPKNSIPGTGFAGIIESVGKTVKLFKEGDQVFGENIKIFGTNAEYVCVPENGVISIKPDYITFDEAAPICDGAVTSLNFLKNLAKIQPGQKVLINGASGSLGTAAVQIAKFFETEVTAVCSTTNSALVKSLGADKVIDYTKEDFTKSGHKYDIIYDTVGKSSFSASKKALTKNGVYVSPVLSMPLLGDMMCTSIFGKKKARFSATGVLPVAQLKTLLQNINEMIGAGHLKTIIHKTYPLEQIVEAHFYVDKGHKKGNIVITLGHNNKTYQNEKADNKGYKKQARYQ